MNGFRRFLATVLAVAALVGAAAPGVYAEEEQPVWQSNDDYEPVGDPAAVEGGTIVDVWLEYPSTLRTEGPNSNTMANSQIHGFIYESLIGLHSATLQYVPGLANKWAISKDKRTFWYKIDPRAKWADGSPVTADDVVATWEHMTDPKISDPYANFLYGESYEKPVAIDAQTVRVTTKKLNWRLFLYIGGMAIYPAKEIRIPGDKYIDEFQWKLQMGSGPYTLKMEDVKKDESLTLTKRPDYWDKDNPKGKGVNNFDRIKWIVIRDEEIIFEKFKKGDLDYYPVGKAQRWKEECDFESVKMGWVQKRKIYNQKPNGFSGFVFNMRVPPFNDIRVRKAFAHLMNREKLMDKLFYNEYEYIDSYWPGSVWGNPDNPKIRFDPTLAAQLLAEAGYKERNAEGWLLGPDGKVFEVELEFGAEAWKRIFTVMQEDFRKAGVKFELKQVDPRALQKKVDERNFSFSWWGWGSILFPNPESSWGSNLADELHNNNLGGFKSKKVDRLCKEYDVEFDRGKQIQLIRKVDSLIFKEYPYALAWYGPHNRVLYWNKFGHPKRYVSRTDQNLTSILSLWWIDPAKEKALKEAMAAGTALPVGETVIRAWDDYKSVDETASALPSDDEGDEEGKEKK